MTVAFTKLNRRLFDSVNVNPATSLAAVEIDVTGLSTLLVAATNTGGTATAAADITPLVQTGTVFGSSGVTPPVVNSFQGILNAGIVVGAGIYNVGALNTVWIVLRNQNATNPLNISCQLLGK